MTAETENAPIDLTFPVAPVDPTISLSVKNTNSFIRVALPQTFDGRYILHASGDPPPVTKFSGGDYMDFSGKERRRLAKGGGKAPQKLRAWCTGYLVVIKGRVRLVYMTLIALTT